MSESDNEPKQDSEMPVMEPHSSDSHTNEDRPGAEHRQWGMFAHLAALSGMIIPFGNVLGPLIVWQMKKEEMPFVDDQGKESLNFQITVSIAMIVCSLLMIVLIGFLLFPIVAIATLAFVIIGAIKANEGEQYRYPVCWRIIK